MYLKCIYLHVKYTRDNETRSKMFVVLIKLEVFLIGHLLTAAAAAAQKINFKDSQLHTSLLAKIESDLKSVRPDAAQNVD